MEPAYYRYLKDVLKVRKETYNMKKLVVLALVAFAFLATARTARVDIPLPECDPCPYVH
jgi:hypothetical protein